MFEAAEGNQEAFLVRNQRDKSPHSAELGLEQLHSSVLGGLGWAAVGMAAMGGKGLWKEWELRCAQRDVLNKPPAAQTSTKKARIWLLLVPAAIIAEWLL